MFLFLFSKTKRAVEDLQAFISWLKQEGENRKTIDIETSIEHLDNICERLKWGIYDLNYYRKKLYKNRAKFQMALIKLAGRQKPLKRMEG